MPKKLSKDEKDTPIPIRLRYLRDKVKLSQRKLGMAALDIEPLSAGSRINQYEHAAYVPGYHLVKRLAKFFDYPPSYFYEPDDKMAQLLESAKDLTKPQLDAFIELMEVAKEQNLNKSDIRALYKDEGNKLVKVKQLTYPSKNK